MATKKSSNVKEHTSSRIKVPHIGPRPRNGKPGNGKRDEKEEEKKRTTRAVRKK